MKLTLAVHPVSEVRLGGARRLDGSVLTVGEEELRRWLLEDERLESVEFDIARPGEACRFGIVFDILEPRAKEPGDGPDFPGVLGPIERVGEGTTHVLRGAAVTILENAPAGRLLEMSGAAAARTPYSKLYHLVIVPQFRAGLERHRMRESLRIASAKAAAYMARAAIGQTPAETEVFESGGPAEPEREGLVRLAYICQVHSRQTVAEVDEHILYGSNTTGMVPVVLHPNEWLDGAVFPGYQSMGVETYFYQNQPIIRELYRLHQEGRITLVGTIATMAASNNEDRDRNTMMASSLAKWNLAADGVVLTKFGGGAPHSDMAITAKLCEAMGIRTVVQVGPPDLSSDRTAESASLFNYPEVDAIVYSSGGGFVNWPAAPVERVIAPSPALETSLMAMTEIIGSALIGVTSQQGASRLRTFVY